MKDLRNKVVVLTGAGSGIGRATALELGRREALVAAVDINEATVTETARLVGDPARAFTCDVANGPAMWELAGKIVAEFGRIDVVINNAGIARQAKGLLDFDLSAAEPVMGDIHRLAGVNIYGVVHGCLAFLPHLLERPEAHIANVASEAALVAFWGEWDYVMTKFAVRGFTEALQMELAATNVGVTLVLPGATRTPIMQNSPFVDEATRPQLVAKFAKTPGMMTPEQAARRLVQSIVKNRPRALLHPGSRLASGISRALPGAYPRLTAPLIRRLVEKATKVD